MSQKRNPESNYKCFEINENGNTTYQNLADAVRAVITGKFVVLTSYIKKEKGSQINNLSVYLR